MLGAEVSADATTAIIAAVGLALAAGVTAAGSVIVAWVSKRRENKVDKRDDLLVNTLNRLDETMDAMLKSVGGLEEAVSTLKTGQTDIRVSVYDAEGRVLDRLGEHQEADNRGWAYLGVPDEVLHPTR